MTTDKKQSTHDRNRDPQKDGNVQHKGTGSPSNEKGQRTPPEDRQAGSADKVQLSGQTSREQESQPKSASGSADKAQLSGQTSREQESQPKSASGSADKAQLSGQTSREQESQPKSASGSKDSSQGLLPREASASGDRSAAKGRTNPSDLEGAKPNASEKYNQAYAAVMCDYREGALRGKSKEVVKDRNEAKALASAAGDKTGLGEQPRTSRQA